MKGADVVMAGIVQYNDWLEEEVGVTQGGKTGPQKRDLEAISGVLRWVSVFVTCGYVTNHPKMQQLTTAHVYLSRFLWTRNRGAA